MPALLDHPSVLAHTIYETLAFDTTLSDEGFNFEATSFSNDGEEWPGISDIILGNPDWFETWLTAEKECWFFPGILFVSEANELLFSR